MTIPTIGPSGKAGASPSTMSDQDARRWTALILIALPTAVAANVLLWAAAFWVMRQS